MARIRESSLGKRSAVISCRKICELANLNRAAVNASLALLITDVATMKLLSCLCKNQHFPLMESRRCSGSRRKQSIQRLQPECLRFKDPAEIARHLLCQIVESGDFSVATERTLCHLLRQRGHWLVRDAAGDNQLEIIEVGAHVESKTVGGDCARNVNSDGCDLSRDFILRPDAGQAGNAFGDHAEIAAGADERFFQLADKINGANARLKSTQIKDGIADELAGAVEGDVAAAIGFMQFNAIGGKKLARSDDVFCSTIAAQSDHRRMLQQEQRMADASFFHQTDERLLQLERDGVIHSAEIQD